VSRKSSRHCLQAATLEQVEASGGSFCLLALMLSSGAGKGSMLEVQLAHQRHAPEV